jgi:Spy/CpxP family protein refolding chaperone
MMKIYKKLTILCLLLGSIASTAWASDFNPLPPGKWWENERLTKEIGLTKEQQSKIHDVVYEHAMGMINLNAAVKRAELELGDLVDRPDFEAKAIRTAFTTFQQSRQTLETSRFEMLLSVRQILSNEQWQRLQELRRRFKMNHPEMQNNPRRGGPSEGGRNRRTPRPQGG